MYSISYGGITHHYISKGSNYCNKLNSFGTINNQYIIAMAGNDKFKAGFLYGTDSVCANIYGPITSFNLASNIDFIAGGYNANYSDFKERGLRPISIAGITPVAGFNFKIPIIKTESYKVSLDSLVSVGIITHAITVSF
jgi:hypothetical protein